MRLLKYVETGRSPSTYTFSLIDCSPRDPPPYAILSHRWGADGDEVTVQDIQRGTANTKRGGHKKLEFCAQQATRDDLHHFWLDTCCIDKTSSAELSEVINSMYKWYGNATKCYVYLSDVTTQQEWEEQLQRSNWFTRGRTLQELIVPPVVEFFSAEGQKLGDKTSLQPQIHQITNISIEALQGKLLSDIPEQERFSWAVGRQTTIEEDVVYCTLDSTLS